MRRARVDDRARAWSSSVTGYDREISAERSDIRSVAAAARGETLIELDEHQTGPRQRWHQQHARWFPDSFVAYDDVPRLFREHILPGHVPPRPLLSPSDTVVTLGSCFAEELREVLQEAEFGSDLFWVPSGLNSTFALLDFVAWAVTGSPTRRAYRYERTADGEIGEWTAGHPRAWYTQQIRDARAFVFTLGLSEVWFDRETDGVFWLGVPERIYNPERHELRRTSPPENTENILETLRLVRSLNRDAPIVLTLSPVPLRATFRDISCTSADCVSKAVLRVAIDDVMASQPRDVYYWPSFELVKWGGAAFDWRAYGQDARHVEPYLVQEIVGAFVESYYGEEAAALLRARLRRSRRELRAPHPLRRTFTTFRRLDRRIRWKLSYQGRHALTSLRSTGRAGAG